MDSLAPELLDAVIELLGPSDLLRCCTVSQRWQSSVERLTFRDIRLKSTDLERFSDIFSDHRRREVLATIEYHVILPPYDDKRCDLLETAEDMDSNNEAFTEAFHGLFGMLHAWGHDNGQPASNQTRGCPIKLKLAVYSPTDYPFRHGMDNWVTRTLWQQTAFSGPQYEYSFLRLLQEELPTVLRIWRFESLKATFRPRNVEGAALAAIAAKLPDLESIDWQINDDEKKFPLLRQQRRYDFAQALYSLPNVLPALKTFNIHLKTVQPSNHNTTITSSLHSSSPSIDHLSIALYTLSCSGLTCLYLTGAIRISPNIFSGAASAAPAFWPNLQYFEIDMHPTTATGEWHWEFDPENPDPDPVVGMGMESDTHTGLLYPFCFFRTKICPKTFNPLMLAMARAVPRMPSIRHLSIKSMILLDGDISVSYCAAGEKHHGAVQPRSKWYVGAAKGAKWEVPKALMRAWLECVYSTREVVFEKI